MPIVSHRRAHSDDVRCIQYSLGVEDFDSTDDNLSHVPKRAGMLNKWTNYLHGWQLRYVVLRAGTLAYYRSEQDLGYGCRGAVLLQHAEIKPHDIDECRFDICVNGNIWYLRAENKQEAQEWMDAMEAHKAESGFGSQSSLCRHGSSVSVCSTGSSTCSMQGLREKLNEIDMLRDMLCKQLEGMQCRLENAGFRTEMLTIKTAAIKLSQTALQCAELILQREDIYKHKIEKEQDQRRKAEEQINLVNGHRLETIRGGPDYMEGPHSTITEEEFFDAVEVSLDKLEEAEKLRDNTIIPIVSAEVSSPDNQNLSNEIEHVLMEQLHYALEGVDGGTWSLFAQEGPMRLYKREEEIGGLVCDPLKAAHCVSGVTAREMCETFWNPQTRKDWDLSLDTVHMLAAPLPSTLIFHQFHKRVWPAAQRDAVFWSHIRNVNDLENFTGSSRVRGARDLWIVCNHSMEHPDVPPSADTIRVQLTVCLVCQTSVRNHLEGEKLSRDNLMCHVFYCSVINPGGWAPAAVLRAVYKREYPRFLKRFTQFVEHRFKDQPILF